MKHVLAYCLLSVFCFADTTNNITLSNNLTSDVVDIVTAHTQATYFVKTNNIILTGEFIKDFSLNRVQPYTTLKIEF